MAGMFAFVDINVNVLETSTNMAEKRTRKSRVASNSRLDDYTKLFAVVSTSAIIAVAFFAVYFDEISQRGELHGL